MQKSLGLTSIRQRKERDNPRIIRNRERLVREAKEEAVDLFIEAYFPRDGKEPTEEDADRAIQAIMDSGATTEQIENEMGKKELTPTLRAFLNLSREGKMRNLHLLNLTSEVQRAFPQSR